MRRMMTHVISDDKNIGEFITHSGVIDRHEACVDDDTQRDKQIDESVHDEQFHHMGEGLPARRTLPAIDQLRTLALHVVFPRQSLVEVQETWIQPVRALVLC